MIALKKIGSRAWKALIPKNDNQSEISYFDVKELYDAAYAEKAKARVSLKSFRTLLDKAKMADNAYRERIAQAGTNRYGRAA